MSIYQSLENLRQELIEQGEIRGLQDPYVIKLSQKLDELINAYYRYKLVDSDMKNAG